MRKIESRSAEIDTEVCVNNVGNRYDLIIVGAQRLRELKKQTRDDGSTWTSIDALKDVQSRLVKSQEYLAKVR